MNTVILGVDVDGGFGKYAVLPAQNARLVPSAVPRKIASMLDAVGNGVHTALAGPVEGRTILITGMGPIGLFAVGVCKAMGASKVYGTEVSPFRIGLAEQMGVDVVLNPTKVDAAAELSKLEPLGVDVSLEMSGHPSALTLSIDHTRPGGRVSLLGVYPENSEAVDINKVIFKGLDVQGIVGRRLWETWDQMSSLFTERGLDLTPIVTHEVPYTEVSPTMEMLLQGQAGKIVLDFADAE